MAQKSAAFYTIGSEILKGFEITSRIGRGQFGEVWKVREKDNNREFAAKVINLQENDSSGLKEVRALKLVARLNHIHLVNIHTFQIKQVNDDLIPFLELDHFVLHHKKKLKELVIIMELGDQSLSDRLKEYQSETDSDEGLPSEELLRYMYGAARGIDYLYANNQIVHCDIKPANLLIFGQDVKVADCGVAVSISNGGTQTVAMSPYYSPPELNRFRPGQWSDQYSLAITYYQLRTGTLPFSPKLGQFDVMTLHDKGQLEFPSPIISSFELQVIKDATALSAPNRFPNCEAFVKQIERALRGERPKRPLEFSTPNLLLTPPTASGVVRQKKFREHVENENSGAVTFTRAIRKVETVETDVIEQLIDVSKKQSIDGDTVEPASSSVETDVEMVALKTTDNGQDTSEDGSGTLQLHPRNARKSSAQTKSESSWNVHIPESPSSSSVRLKSKALSPAIPAIAISAILITAIAGIGIMILSGRKPIDSTVKTSISEPSKTSSPQKTSSTIPAGNAIKIEIPKRFNFNELTAKIGLDPETLGQGLAEATIWYTSQNSKDWDQADFMLASNVLAEVKSHHESLNQFQAELSKHEANLETFINLLCECESSESTVASLPVPQYDAHQDLADWHTKVCQTILARKQKLIGDRLNDLCRKFESDSTKTLQHQLDHMTWLIQNKESKYLQYDSSRLNNIWKQAFQKSGSNEVDQKVILDFVFQDNLRYPTIPHDEKQLLANWDNQQINRNYELQYAKKSNQIEVWDMKQVLRFEADMKEFEPQSSIFEKRHPGHSLNWKKPDDIVMYWREINTVPPTQKTIIDLRNKLLKQAFIGLPKLESSLVNSYMKSARDANESITNQRQIREKYKSEDKVEQQFQINLGRFVQNELIQDRVPDWNRIKSECKGDLANGWLKAAVLEESILNRRTRLVATNAESRDLLAKQPDLPIVSFDLVESKENDLSRYQHYLRAWSQVINLRNPKHAKSRAQPYPEIEKQPKERLEACRTLIDAISTLKKEKQLSSLQSVSAVEETILMLLEIPKPPEKPLEQFAHNPYNSSLINIDSVISLFETVEKDFDRKLTPVELTHYALALSAAKFDDRAKRVFKDRSPSMPDVPDGTVHPAVGLSYFQLESNQSTREEAIANSLLRSIRFFYADTGSHFSNCKKTIDGEKINESRFKTILKAIANVKLPDSFKTGDPLKLYTDISNYNTGSINGQQLLVELRKMTPQLASFERSIALGYESHLSLQMFRINSTVDKATRPEWNRVFAIAKESNDLWPNYLASRALAMRDAAECDSENIKSLYVSPNAPIVCDYQNRYDEIRQVKLLFDKALLLYQPRPNSELLRSRASYFFHWGISLGKRGLGEAKVAELLSDSLHSITLSIEQYEGEDYSDYQLRSNIFEDLGWMTSANRSENYKNAIADVILSLSLAKKSDAKDNDIAKILIDYVRILKRATLHDIVKIDELVAHLKTIDIDLSKYVSASEHPLFWIDYSILKCRINRSESIKYSLDRLNSLAVDPAVKIDSNSRLIACTIYAEMLLQIGIDSEGIANLSRKLSDDFASLKLKPIQNANQWEAKYLEGLISHLNKNPDQAKQLLIASSLDLKSLIVATKFDYEWSSSVHMLVLILEEYHDKLTNDEIRLVRELAEALIEKFGPAIPTADFSKIKTYLSR